MKKRNNQAYKKLEKANAELVREQVKSQEAMRNTRNQPIRNEIGDNNTNQYR